MSSSSPLVAMRGVAKRYRLGSGPSVLTAIRDLFSNDHGDEVEALCGVDLELRPKEIMGLVGPNGAGKSTVLRLLAEITPPSQGVIEMRGRPSSLLDVGAGFHYELTGRENILFSGAIYGMTRAEIRKKLPKIIEMAEVDRFLDTPMKRYSTGMILRLGIAIAMHVDAEFMLIDEIISAADTSFQKRLEERISAYVRAGGAAIIASHELDLLGRLCDTAVHLEAGRVVRSGPAKDVLESYRESADQMTLSRIHRPL